MLTGVAVVGDFCSTVEGALTGFVVVIVVVVVVVAVVVVTEVVFAVLFCEELELLIMIAAKMMRTIAAKPYQ